MRELTSRALECARRSGAQYADIRVISEEQQGIMVKNGAVQSLTSNGSHGFGVRVVVDGAWGFAASSLVTPAEVVRVAEEAARVARASALVKRSGEFALSPLKGIEDSYATKVAVDPFKVKLEDKLGLLLEADRLMRQDQRVRVSAASMHYLRERQVFASTEGSYITQEIVETGAGINATAVAAGEMQRRSYPASFSGDAASAGYEFVQAMDLPAHAQRVAKEAGDLLQAEQCPSGVMDLILEGSQLGLQIHESCGHPIELDRVFGQEASYAGTSFLTPEKLGSFTYGSPHVTIAADATIPGGLGSFGYDDEGVPAQRSVIVDRGLFTNYLTSRESAAQLGQSSNGTMRADGWERMPIIRMTNVNLEPGDWTLDEIIKDTRQGILMATNKSWSIDDKRLNFQFGTEAGWLIEDGSLTRLVKNPTYTGITPEFWGSCDAIADKREWHVWGLSNCGKGEPSQTAHVGHGAAPARFRNVRVGVGRW